MYKLDFGMVLKRLDEVTLEEKSFDYENANFAYHFTVEYPSVERVL